MPGREEFIVGCSMVHRYITSLLPSSYRYMNALEAPSVQFAMSISREMLRSKKELKKAIHSENRHSNGVYLPLSSSIPSQVLSMPYTPATCSTPNRK